METISTPTGTHIILFQVVPGQTQTIPNGGVDASDFFYFTDAYILYYSNHIENPYADLTTQGTINGASFLAFLSDYLYYFTHLQYDDLMQKNLGNSMDLVGGENTVSSGIISAVQQGTTNSAWSVGPSPNPINSTIKVNIRVDNASNIWGWSIPDVTWNASVLQLTKVVEGPFLSDNTCGDSPSMVGNSRSLFDNGNGTIMGGLAEGIQGEDVSTDSSGVLATLYFNVTGSGVATVNLSGATLYANSTDTVGTSIAANNATITVKTPPPYKFSDGFETGDFSMWQESYCYPSNVAPTVSSAEAHSGTYSAYFPAEQAGNYAFLIATFSPQSSLDFRYYMNLPSTAGNYGFSVAEFEASNGDNIYVVLNSATGRFELAYYNSNDDCYYRYYSSAQTVTANTWFCTELSLTSTTFALYYNGSAILTGTFTDGPTGLFSNAYLADFGSAPAFYIDDVAIGNSYIGP